MTDKKNNNFRQDNRIKKKDYPYPFYPVILSKKEKLHYSHSFQIFAVRAATSGIAGRGALGTGSYQNVAVDQSSRRS